ncbi:hypothetical protein HDU98_009362 [Podochytrium sp. JEL0797]|nr:hypothetical protein HDU98_009362 [Podochytrium sp. JEL0797]
MVPTAAYTTALVVSNFFQAMAVENNLRGIILSIQRIRDDPLAKITPLVVLACNLLAAISSVLFISGSLATQLNCFAVELAMNLAYHLFMLTFDGFILYKTYLVTSEARWFLLLAGVGLMNRVPWMALDLRDSHGVWNFANEVCVWNQNSTTSLGYMSADIICDLCATTTALVYCSNYFSTNIRRLFVILATENVLRSFFSLLIMSVSMGLVTNEDPIQVMYFSGVSMYMFAHILNSEFFFYRKRTTAVLESHRQAQASSPMRLVNDFIQEVDLESQAPSTPSQTPNTPSPPSNSRPIQTAF